MEKPAARTRMEGLAGSEFPVKCVQGVTRLLPAESSPDCLGRQASPSVLLASPSSPPSSSRATDFITVCS